MTGYFGCNKCGYEGEPRLIDGVPYCPICLPDNGDK